MRIRALYALALYALAFVLWPGLHQVLPAGACTSCAGEPARAAAPCDPHRGACCEHACGERPTADAASASGDSAARNGAGEREPSPQEPAEDDGHCTHHCGACRVVHDTALDVPALVPSVAHDLACRPLHVSRAESPRTPVAAPKAARAPPVLG